MTRPALLLAIAVFAVPGTARARTDIGARPVALGGAFTAVADDELAYFWNPGGMAFARGLGAAGGIAWAWDLTRQSHGAVTFPVGGPLRVGLGVSYLEDDRDTSFVEDLALGPAVAWRPLPWLGLGGVGNLVSSREDSASDQALLADLGLSFRPFEWFGLGVTARDLGPARGTIAARRPLELRGGTQLTLPLSASYLKASADIWRQADPGSGWSVGIEMYIPSLRSDTLPGGLYSRVGYRRDDSPASSWSFGAGYDYSIGRWFELVLDVVYLAHGRHRGSEHVSLTLRVSPW